MTISREVHDRCLATITELRTKNPELVAILARRGPLKIGSPLHAFSKDLDALNEVASSFATGDRASKATMKRALGQDR